MESSHTGSRRAVMVIVAFLCVIVPFLTWRVTWFGRRLSDREMGQYLYDAEKPRRIQHALAQISDRIVQGETPVRTWYPRVIELARHPDSRIRINAAWVMGQDNGSEPFHEALRALLNDPEVMVRRNAALSLVRFGDDSGRSELTDLLRPHLFRAAEAGRVALRCRPGQQVEAGTVVARIGDRREMRSPVFGEVKEIFVRDGSEVAAGVPLISVSPGADQVWEALRGLYLVGQPEDLPAVERFRLTPAGFPDRLRQQAALTAQAIRTRAERTANR